MTLPHPDLSRPSPWAEWPAGIPAPAAAVRARETVGDEARDIHRITMPNGAIAETWTVIGSWDGDEDHAFTGNWAAYNLVFDEVLGILDGEGSGKIYEALEEWADQERGVPCEACRCSGRIAAYPFVSVHDSWIACVVCSGAGWTPHGQEAAA
jgi:hypothetical protein